MSINFTINNYLFTLANFQNFLQKFLPLKMSFLRKLNPFGAKKGRGSGPFSPPSSSKKSSDQHRTTLERLREMEDLLQKKQTHLENQIEAQLAIARKLGKTNKRAALQALKRKRRLEAELQRMDGTLTTIELQREALENARNNVQVLGAMQQAAGVLKNAQKYLTPDKVLDVMDEVNEQQELAREVADAISNPLQRMDAGWDDQELERELEALEQEDLDKALLKVERNLGVVEVDGDAAGPSSGGAVKEDVKETLPASVEDLDDKDLAELAQWSV